MKIIYTMEVTEKIHFNNYYKDKRFKNRADNIYHVYKRRMEAKKKTHFTMKNDTKHDIKYGICFNIR